jgi:pyrroloquinoline quinone (PQQ) biosynthesis protein C
VGLEVQESLRQGDARTSERVRWKQRLVSHRLGVASDRIWGHPDAARLYPSLLFRSFCLARAAVSLMTAATARLDSLRGEDPVAAELIDILTHLASEEAGHDEWALQDLEALGVPRSEVLARIPPPSVAALTGAQYYWIAHHHPVSMLGYCFVTETAPRPIENVEDFIRRTGLPRQAFRSLLLHAFIDIQHGADMERALDTLPLSDDHLAMIGVSVMHTTHALALTLEEILDQYEIRGGSEGGKVQFY